MRYKQLLLQDIGGLKTADHKEVRTGLLYRSGDLFNILPRDLERVQSLNLKQVVDLREEETARRRPDSFTPPRAVNLPLRLGPFEELNLRAALRREIDWARFDFQQLYVLILEENKDYLNQFLNLLADGPRPLLLHCTAGKDRTGIFAAALLLALRVPAAQVMRWYLSIEPHLKKHTPSWVKFLVWYSKTPWETIYLNRPAIQAALDHLDRQYQGIEGYLDEIGFTRLGELREIFLK
ncbi:MAG: tyrosine-protein phosphatase [Bacillota bacterium]